MNVVDATADAMKNGHVSDSCRGMADLIVGHFLADLNSDDESRVLRHLEVCESCRKRLTALEDAWDAV
jgi:hypothetical protein